MPDDGMLVAGGVGVVLIAVAWFQLAPATPDAPPTLASSTAIATPLGETEDAKTELRRLRAELEEQRLAGEKRARDEAWERETIRLETARRQREAAAARENEQYWIEQRRQRVEEKRLAQEEERASAERALKVQLQNQRLEQQRREHQERLDALERLRQEEIRSRQHRQSAFFR